MDETAIIEEPPKLRSGNGSPVKVIKPPTVAIFIKICLKSTVFKSLLTYFEYKLYIIERL